VTGRDLDKRGFLRRIVTERYKFSRYFAPGGVEDLASAPYACAVHLMHSIDRQLFC